MVEDGKTNIYYEGLDRWSRKRQMVMKPMDGNFAFEIVHDNTSTSNSSIIAVDREFVYIVWHELASGTPNQL